MDEVEQRRHGEEIVLYHMFSFDKVHYFGLCAARAVYHTMDIRTHLVKQFLDYRSVCAGGGEYEFSGIYRCAFHFIGQAACPGIYQFCRNCMIVAFRIFFGKFVTEHVVPGRSETIGAHTSVIFIFIGSLSIACETYDYVASGDIGVVYHIGTLHAACDGAVDDDCAYEVANIGGLSSGAVDIHTHLA